MAENFKKCSQGHYYKGASCPYCTATPTPQGPVAGPQAGTDAPTEYFVHGATAGDMANPYQPQPDYKQNVYPHQGRPSQMETVITPGMQGAVPAGGYRPSSAPTKWGDGAGPQQAGYQAGNENVTIQEDGLRPQSSPFPYQAGGSQHTVFGEETDYSQQNYPEAGGYNNYPFGQQRPNNRKLVGWLVSYTLDSAGVDFKLYEGRNIIGRDYECNVTLATDGRVSNKHAILHYRAGRFTLQDEKSSHGTFVNGRDIALDPVLLADGDTIKMGSTLLKFRTAIDIE